MMELGDTRLCTGRMASLLPSPGCWRKPWHRKRPGHCRTLEPPGAWEWSWDLYPLVSKNIPEKMPGNGVSLAVGIELSSHP